MVQLYITADLQFQKVEILFQKVDLSLQNSGPFICEGGSSEPTECPWLWACIYTYVTGFTKIILIGIRNEIQFIADY